MKGRTLLIRADADPQIGTGHVMRCLALGQAWQDDGGDVTWACHRIPDGLLERIRKENMDLERVPAGAPALAGVVREHSPSWVALDGRFDLLHQRAARGRDSRVLFVADDASAGEYEVDLVLDPNVFADEGRYATLEARRVLAGPRYALLRRELTRTTLTRARLGARVLLTFGGADPARLSSTALAALALLYAEVPSLQATLVLGAATPHQEEIVRSAYSLPFVRTLYDVVDMGPHLAWADVAVAAAGGTCLELAYAGVPILAVVTADNQRRVAAALVERGIARSLGEARDIDAPTLAHAIGSLLADTDARASMGANGPGLVDGQGARRAVSAMVACP
jgi:UDP-2,4-diacetamido-2,4,6-trideoxy-beta-L-altropyranose hydrolase